MAKVAFRNVSKRFDADTVALNRFNLSVDDGEFMVLVGPSGCGKSTALRLLAGLETVSEGDILIDDNVVNETTAQQRNVAMVFQNYALYPHMTVRENLAFPLKMARRSKPAIEETIREIAGLLDLTELLARKPKQLSGGQRQRVAMGRALVRDPSVFLLDEPLSNLDARLRAQIRADIARLQKRLIKTTLYVTHDQVEAMTLGDRVAVMNRGELQQVGTPEELYTRPQNTFVARFIGSPGMNIIPARLTRQTGQAPVLQLSDQVLPLTATDPQISQTVSDYLDQTLFTGIRPEAFRTSPAGDSAKLAIKVVSVEYLGHESLIYFQLASGEADQSDEVLIARVEGQYQAAPNSEAVLYFEPDAIYLFDSAGQYVAGG